VDHADQDSTFSDVSALSVEQCDCPDGYSGTSCEVSIRNIFRCAIFKVIHCLNLFKKSHALLVINDQIVDFTLAYANHKIDNNQIRLYIFFRNTNYNFKFTMNKIFIYIFLSIEINYLN